MSRTEVDQKYHDLIHNCDLMIRSGKINQTQALMTNLVTSRIPRSARQGLAKCCRRIGLIGLGLRILHPVIRVQKVLDEPIHASEVAEYSALLARNGSVAEAMELLKSVDPSMAPEAHLYLGQCHILNWEYEEASLCFQKFLRSDGDEYSKLISRVNLISCFIVLFKLDEAHEMLKETILMAQVQGATRLVANCYELWGQLFFWKNDFPLARRMLRRATDLLDDSRSHDQLLILKTKAVMASMEENSVKPLLSYRNLALQRRHWEGVRDADFFILRMNPSQKQLDHLIFGSPMLAYRQRVEKLIGLRPSSSYLYGSEQGPQLNLQTGRVTGVEALPLGKQIHQVISALVRDFYAPISLGSLFSELYPDEYFDEESSPFRIRQAILRTREWLKKNKIPAQIEQSQGTYQLVFAGEMGIRIDLEHPPVNPTLVRWQLIKESFTPGSVFTSEEVCHQLGWSRTTFRRLADWACANELISRVGVGKATTYHINSEK